MQPIIFEPTARRIRVEFNKVMIADSTRAMIEIETPIPVYYLPLSDIRQDLLSPSSHTTFDQRRGSARFWSIEVGDRRAENALWNYPQPLPGAPPLAPYAAFKLDLVDHWYEEDEEIFRHARNPYKRVDAIRSSRRVEVIIGGARVANTRRAVFLFETGLPTRYYIPREDVRTELLRPTSHHTTCPFKGEASYWSAGVGGEVHENLVWSYETPIPQAEGVASLMCFYPDRTELTVNGERQPA